MFWGFYSSAELTFISWWRGSFLVGKILLNTRISWDFFLIGIPLIRVNRGVQDISLHGCSWRSSKAMLDPSCSLFSLAYYFTRGFPHLHVYAVKYRGEVIGLRHLFRMSSHVGEADEPNGAVDFLVCNVFIKYPR